MFEGKIGYSLIPKERSIDIDDTLDYMVANFLSKKKPFHNDKKTILITGSCGRIGSSIANMLFKKKNII